MQVPVARYPVESTERSRRESWHPADGSHYRGAMHAPRKVVAIVVSWNGGEEAAAAVASLVDQRVRDGLELKVVLADNDSDDDTVALVRQRSPEARILELGHNLGYGAAANRAMAEFPAEFALVCNQDAVYQPGFVDALVGALLEDDSLGATTAQVRLAGEFVRADDEDGGDAERIFTGHDGARWRRVRAGEHGVELLNSTGNQLTTSGNGRDRGWLAPVGSEFPRAVFGFHGGACALRVAAVEPLGGFDESYFMYYEDTDLAMRLRRAGWAIEYVPEAISVHAHATSSGTTSPRFVEWNARNRAWNARRNGPASMRMQAVARTAVGALKGLVAAADPRRHADERALARARARGALAGLGRLPRSASTNGTTPADAAAEESLATDVAGSAARVPGPTPQRAWRQPRTLIDLTSVPAQLGGVGRYLEGLVTGLEQLGARPVLVAKPEHVEHFRALAPHAEVHSAPRTLGKRGFRFAWEQSGLLRLATDLGAEVIHSPHYTFPRATPLGRVVTVHDATFFSDPEAHSGLKRRFFQRWIRDAVRANVTLVAPSAATAREIERYAGTPRRPIVVAHHGVDRGVFHEPSEAELTEFRAAHGLGDARWIAFLGTIEPRKRVGELIRAYRMLRAELGAKAPLLLISGARGWDEDAIALLDEEAADPDSGVRELGYLPLEQLRCLLGGAEVFCYPSIAEGFGLPVLEAMACGAPVVTTPLTALPEVGGDAATYCDPEAESIAAAISGVLVDPDAVARMRAAGLARADEFTWARCARFHLDAYAASVRRMR